MKTTTQRNEAAALAAVVALIGAASVVLAIFAA